ncbi:hypothetical protein DOM22_09300 [Bdellovibrio sp. ZAP7]|uniref:hypothetical protein n=1 Tax=Bdellovibrio sp. ZAP7 TaxID=2231053 RepID=UPI0011575AE5|nr:hypothetical protein [Bdellovibrio sp. ZAP7]QDK45334.1 hypothetical protein DOM22_09300 [Bdellovibrio sp. ZAP7]
MVKLISAYTGPSISTLAKIHLVNSLNSAGIRACFYGNERWPEGRCEFRPLGEFNPTSKDTILNDGFKINSFFELVNLDYHRYSAGRKRRLLQVLKCLGKYVYSVSKLSMPDKCILFKHFDQKTAPRYYDLDASDAANELIISINEDSILATQEDGKTKFAYDICAQNNLQNRILNSATTTVVLAGAITEPNYFRQSVLPLLENEEKMISYIGLQEETLRKISEILEINCKKSIEKWLTLLR